MDAALFGPYLDELGCGNDSLHFGNSLPNCLCSGCGFTRECGTQVASGTDAHQRIGATGRAQPLDNVVLVSVGGVELELQSEVVSHERLSSPDGIMASAARQ